MKFDIVSTGKSAFLDWDQLDILVYKWGKAYFGEHVNCEAKRDGTDCNITVTNMVAGDYDKFERLYKLYDKDEDYEAKFDFEDGILPDCITLGVVSEILSNDYWGRFGSCLATYDGVYFMEHSRHDGERLGVDIDMDKVANNFEVTYTLVATKSVPDADGFVTDYSWYKGSDGTHVFVFGDNEMYRPEDGCFDHVCEDEREAREWYDNYKGFEDELDAFSLDCMVKSAEAEKAEIEAEVVVMTYAQMTDFFHMVEKNGKMKEHVEGYIVFDKDTFDKEYSELSRTYVVSSDNKAFQPGMIGYSIYGSCLDGTDQCLRMDNWIRGFACKRWDIERCYMKREEYNRGCKVIEGKSREDRGWICS